MDFRVLVVVALRISSAQANVFVVFMLGVFVMRSAGCVINDYADRDVDGLVQRTKDRPLAVGAVSPHECLFLAAGLALVALALVLTMNSLTILLAVVGAGLAIVYPFLKRITSLPQIWLGAAFAWGVPMAFAAQLGELPKIAWLTFFAVVIWTTAYDTMYAMVDREDDEKAGIKSIAILFADLDRFWIGIMQLMTLFALYLVGKNAELGFWYFLGLGIAAILAVYQQILIRKRERDKCFKAFLNNNWFGAVIFIGVMLDYTFR